MGQRPRTRQSNSVKILVYRKRWHLLEITDVACMGKHKPTRTIRPSLNVAPYVPRCIPQSTKTPQ
eukprot:8385119-Ditylum_brightwellii.AAC.1